VRIEFCVFDHLDRGGFPLGELYSNRLRIVEAYDACGFYAYHLAEHHATSLGLAPSPGIMLSAVAQRTTRLRLGPMVYVLPLHEPLRLIEEICMLDQMSGGRLELGLGRGSSPFELAYFGVGHLESQKRYAEAREIVLAGLSQDVLNFEGRHFNYINVPMVLKPVQRPHPPLWYGLTRPDGAAWAARESINVVTNGAIARIRPLMDRYCTEWQTQHGNNVPLPRLAVSRHIYVGETTEEAEDTGRRAYDNWYRSNAELWRAFATESLVFPKTYDEAISLGTLIVGTPDDVRTSVQRNIEGTRANYLMGRYAFGDIPLDRVLRSVQLFAKEVMPAFAADGGP
jgi:alkanesulfonate monooxygenase SsuD/methylene tetrahydromethanopterin reductase-like flavin-dependent oxidoreductase (luciferase family)